jgi:peptidoglycan/xylan/chitin deacetylase (PgdA/CDA1 family)
MKGTKSDKMILKILGRLFPEYVFRSSIGRAKKNSNWKTGILILSFDCEYRKDITALPQLIKLLKKYKIKASFACIGKWIEEYPEVHKQILSEGHEILNHSYSHPNHDEVNPKLEDFLSLEEKEADLAKCHNVCKRVLGYDMRGYRAPHFATINMEPIYPALKRIGYVYSSSTVASMTKTGGMPYKEQEIVEIPVSVCPKHPWAVLDSYHSFVMKKHTNDFRDMITKLLDATIKNKILANLYFDPSVVHEKDFEYLLEQISESRDKVKVMTLKDIAKLSQ